jgi:hypothetical protein
VTFIHFASLRHSTLREFVIFSEMKNSRVQSNMNGIRRHITSAKKRLPLSRNILFRKSPSHSGFVLGEEAKENLSLALGALLFDPAMQQKAEINSRSFFPTKLISRISPKALFMLLTLLGHVGALRKHNEIKKNIPHMLKKGKKRNTSA